MTRESTPGDEHGLAPGLFLRFLNTLAYEHGQPTDQLPDVPALLAWLRDEHLLSDRASSMERARLGHDEEEGRRRLERFQHLRDVLRRAAAEQVESGAVQPTTIRALNHILRHGLHYHQVEVNADGVQYGLARVGDRLDQARASIASSFAAFLAEDRPDRLRICANTKCREVFVDRSAAGRRRWCSMRVCGNRAKVAAHRRRTRSATARGVPAEEAGV